MRAAVQQTHLGAPWTWGPGVPPPRTPPPASQTAPGPAPGPPLNTSGLLARPCHARHFDWNCFCRKWGPSLELGGGLWFQNSVRLQPRQLNQRTRVGTAPTLRPLLAVRGLSPHSWLYSQVPRNQFHCVTKETSLNVKKPDNWIVSRTPELSLRLRSTRASISSNAFRSINHGKGTLGLNRTQLRAQEASGLPGSAGAQGCQQAPWGL